MLQNSPSAHISKSIYGQYLTLKKEWNECTRCPLHCFRKRVVMFRGRIPADILILGEAPGESEDTLGYPFVGPAGNLLDQLLIPEITNKRSYCIVNLVGCIPKNTSLEGPREPIPQEIIECRPRITQLITLCNPEAIVTLGELASKYLPIRIVSERRFHCPHPASVLREQSETEQHKKMLKIQDTLTAAFRYGKVRTKME